MYQIESNGPEETLNMLKEHWDIKEKQNICIDWDSLLPLLKNDEDNEINAKILFEILFKSSSMQSISNKYSLSIKCVKNLINTYKKNIWKIKTKNRRSLNKHKKLKEDHISYIKEYWEDNIGKHYTLSIITNNLLIKFPDLKSISCPTIAKWLKYKLNMSFKKSNRINSKIQQQQNKRLIFESVILQHYFEFNDYQVIFVDEF